MTPAPVGHAGEREAVAALRAGDVIESCAAAHAAGGAYRLRLDGRRVPAHVVRRLRATRRVVPLGRPGGPAELLGANPLAPAAEDA